MRQMLATPTFSPLSLPSLSNLSGNFPLRLELSPEALLVLFLVAGVFFAAMSVIFVYHWRRFPYEQEIFNRVEVLYFGVASALLAIAFISIFI
jgi:tellurite resistance protein TehA-like permease